MADFFSSRLLRWLTVPARSRVLNIASKPFYSVADRILGSQFLEDIAEFFLLFQTMYDGFVERAKAVTRMLADQRTTFVVVSTLESAPVREAEFFIDALEDRGLHLGAVVLNKVLPTWFLDQDATGAAKALLQPIADELAAELARRASASRSRSAGAARGGRELPQLPGGGQARGRDPRRARRRARGGGDGALLRPRHHRPGRAPRPRRADLAVSAAPARRVASGHPATTAAAVEVLGAGGNAFDACVAAGFAAAVAEPTLTSLGGGGFLLARTAAGEEVLFDFFVDTPGRGAPAPTREPRLRRGRGALPRRRPGLPRRASARWPCPAAWPASCTPTGGSAGCRSTTVVAPGSPARAERRGGERPAGLRAAAPRADPHAHPGGRGDRRAGRPAARSAATGSPTPTLAAFLGDARRARASPTPALAARDRRGDGSAAAACVTAADLAAYTVVEREPLAVHWRGHRLLTNPPPAFGGELVALGLLELEAAPGWPADAGSVDHAVALAEAMVATDEVRAAGTVGERLAGDGRPAARPT